MPALMWIGIWAICLGLSSTVLGVEAGRATIPSAPEATTPAPNKPKRDAKGRFTSA